jgi:hypothetical protein
MLGSSSAASQLAAFQGFNPMKFIMRAFYWKDLGKSKEKKLLSGYQITWLNSDPRPPAYEAEM